MAEQDEVSKRFDVLRKRAKQAAQTATQKEREGLQRRFAQIGQVGSGAQIRAEAQAAERGAKRLERAEETVGMAELGERQRLREIQEQREFARGEREAGQRFGAEQALKQREFGAQQALKQREFGAQQAQLGRQFGAEQALLGRQFAAGEREAGQLFGAEQAQLGRQFATGERQAAQEFGAEQARLGREFAQTERQASQNFASGQAGLDRAIRERSITLQEASQLMQKEAMTTQIDQFERNFARDTQTIDFNRNMSEQQANSSLWDDIGLGGVGRFLSSI